MSRKFSVQITYTADNDDGPPTRARSVFWAEGETTQDAYANARKELEHLKGLKLGAIVPGHVNGIF